MNKRQFVIVILKKLVDQLSPTTDDIIGNDKIADSIDIDIENGITTHNKLSLEKTSKPNGSRTITIRINGGAHDD